MLSLIDEEFLNREESSNQSSHQLLKKQKIEKIKLKDILEMNMEYENYLDLINKYKKEDKIYTDDLILINHQDFRKILKESLNTDNPFFFFFSKLCMYDEDELYNIEKSLTIQTLNVEDLDNIRSSKIVKGSISPKNIRFFKNTNMI